MFGFHYKMTTRAAPFVLVGFSSFSLGLFPSFDSICIVSQDPLVTLMNCLYLGGISSIIIIL
jgi:hypothetical protein